MKVWATTDGAVKEGKFLVVRRDGTIPAWPHFVMGARDPAVPFALRAYADKAKALGMDDDYVKSIQQLAMSFEVYAGAHGHGDPDGGPHRVDQEDVISAMRGIQGEAMIVVRPSTNATKGT
jgi:hypothetical protein